MTKKELENVLEKHEKWVDDKEGGECANLRAADCGHEVKWVTKAKPADRSRVLVAVQDYWDEDDIEIEIAWWVDGEWISDEGGHELGIAESILGWKPLPKWYGCQP